MQGANSIPLCSPDPALAGLMTQVVAALLPDGHAGRSYAVALLNEVERRVPGAVLQVAAGIDLARLTRDSRSDA